MMEIMQILSKGQEITDINFHEDTLDIIIESLHKGMEK